MIDLETLGISKDDILDRAAEKLAAEVGDYEEVHNRLNDMLERRVQKAAGDNLDAVVTDIITKATEKMLDETVQPRNIWGERDGEPTTIRTALSEKARDFWMEKIDKDGKRTNGYGGKPRFEYLVQQYIKDEFEAAMKENIASITQGFREAMTKEAGVWLGEHIAKVFPKTGKR